MKHLNRNHSHSLSTKVLRNFKTTDLVLMMALLIVVASVSGAIVSEAFEDLRPHLARLEVERLALSLSQSEMGREKISQLPAELFESPQVIEGVRVPSSIKESFATEISKDPWGTPYRYRILKSQNGKVKVMVLSAGANKKFESDFFQNETFSKPFSGDDVGFVYDSSKQKAE